jgi:hypothetical protein
MIDWDQAIAGQMEAGTEVRGCQSQILLKDSKSKSKQSLCILMGLLEAIRLR